MVAKHSLKALRGWMLRNHRWFGIVSCIAVMVWGLSGVMHPIMSRLNPVAANPLPPESAAVLHKALPPAAALKRAGVASIVNLRVVNFNGASYYQVSVPGENTRRYFEVNSGEELAQGDARFAEFLARHFIADPQSALVSATRLDAFDDEYLSINRLLPVYRVDLARDDHLRVYVETSPPRLSALVDERKALLGNIFRLLHNWDFLAAWDSARQLLICLFLAVTLLSALSGLWMYGFLWQHGSLKSSHAPLRRWHRTLGIAVSVSALLFVVSAAWHLLGSARRTAPVMETSSPIAAELLTSLPVTLMHGNWGNISLLAFNQQPYYQLSAASPVPAHNMAEHDHSAAAKSETTQEILYVHAVDGSVLPDAVRRHAIALAGAYSKLAPEQVTQTRLITRFEGEYGFFNKRLPVWRVDYDTPDHVSYYVETGSGALAAVVNDAARAEGWSFSYLHKFHWLDFAGKDVRDFVMALFGLGNLIVAVLGLWLFVRRYRKA
jgi:hypothetical protein